MTTTVRVIAHPPEGKEAVVEVFDNDVPQEVVVLQNGESAEKYVYPGRVVIVTEREKA